MNVLVIYESHSGHTRQAAEAIASAVRAQGSEVNLKHVSAVRGEDVRNADTVFVGTWVQGFILFGVRPARVKTWLPILPSLAGKQVAVFCTYAFNPRNTLRELGNMLEARGAIIKGQHAFHRSNPAEGAEDFVLNTVRA